jgi:hypothetical protein
MISDNFLKKPMGTDDNMPEYIQSIMQDISGDKWNEASNKTEQLSKAWKKVVKRIQFSAEKDEMDALSTSIARLRGAIEAKDKPGAFMELNEIYQHWEDVGK